MTDVLLDTVTLSELRKKAKADASVLKWQYAARGSQAFVSVVTMNEIWYGCRKVEARDAAFARRLKIWYSDILAAPEVYVILPVSLTIAKHAADFRADYGCSYNDSLIAATAKVHGLTLATRNIVDFEHTGISLINPWEVLS